MRNGTFLVIMRGVLHIVNIAWMVVVVHVVKEISAFSNFCSMRSLANALLLAGSFFKTAATCKPK